MIWETNIAFALLMLLAMALGLMAVSVVCRISIWRATKPLKMLAESADEVARGNFNAALPDNLRRNDEIRLLRDSFSNMQQSLTRYIDDLKTTTAAKASIESELAVARHIQMAILPVSAPPHLRTPAPRTSAPRTSAPRTPAPRTSAPRTPAPRTPAPRTTSLTLPCDTSQTERLGEFMEQVCSQAGLDAASSTKLNIAVEEAVVNVMNYAYPADSLRYERRDGMNVLTMMKKLR